MNSKILEIRTLSQKAIGYAFLLNNCCESINNLINNFIQVNSKVGIERFATLVKILFIRLNTIEPILIF